MVHDRRFPQCTTSGAHQMKSSPASPRRTRQSSPHSSVREKETGPSGYGPQGLLAHRGDWPTAHRGYGTTSSSRAVVQSNDPVGETNDAVVQSSDLDVAASSRAASSLSGPTTRRPQ